MILELLICSIKKLEASGHSEQVHGFIFVATIIQNTLLTGKVIKFSMDPDLTHEDCKCLLQKYMPTHINRNKITQKLYIQ